MNSNLFPNFSLALASLCLWVTQLRHSLRAGVKPHSQSRCYYYFFMFISYLSATSWLPFLGGWSLYAFSNMKQWSSDCRQTFRRRQVNIIQAFTYFVAYGFSLPHWTPQLSSVLYLKYMKFDFIIRQFYFWPRLGKILGKYIVAAYFLTSNTS